MNRQILCDLHTHTNFSPDAKDQPEKMCERAAELGLKAYAITDHCDCNFWFTVEELFGNEQPLIDGEMYGARHYSTASLAVQKKLKEKYCEKINLLCGIELGQPLQNISVAEKIVGNKDIDFVIGSHHQNDDMPDFYWIKYNELTTLQIYSLLDSFFEETLAMCEWGKFDVLGHLTYPLRYICGEYGISIDLGRYEEIIREIFRTLIKNGKGIEINTSGIRQKYGLPFPSVEYVKLYRKLGGEIITLGSDAHNFADIGKGIDEGIEIAREAGFKYITYFKQRQPKMLNLDR